MNFTWCKKCSVSQKTKIQKSLFGAELVKKKSHRTFALTVLYKLSLTTGSLGTLSLVPLWKKGIQFRWGQSRSHWCNYLGLVSVTLWSKAWKSFCRFTGPAFFRVSVLDAFFEDLTSSSLRKSLKLESDFWSRNNAHKEVVNYHCQERSIIVTIHKWETTCAIKMVPKIFRDLKNKKSSWTASIPPISKLNAWLCSLNNILLILLILSNVLMYSQVFVWYLMLIQL